jgi:hypothetical protein
MLVNHWSTVQPVGGKRAGPSTVWLGNKSVPGCRLAQASKPDGFKRVQVCGRLELSSSDFDVVWI